MTSAKYGFMPWVRQGAAASITELDNFQDSMSAHVTLPVTLTINNNSTVSVNIRILGHGDVTGIDYREFVPPTDPRPLKTEFESNYFPAVEFDLPDFPWLFTPAAANSQGRLRPWVVLVAVRKREGVELISDTTRPLPILSIKKGASDELPDLKDSWAWAHAQVAGSATGQALKDLIANSPDSTVSRLLCPRKLEPKTSYYACLVPAFEAGLQAGLGMEVKANTLTPAWKPGVDSIDIPIYSHWEFTTSEAGDFESLVRILEPRQLPPEVGRRDMDVSKPGGDLPGTPGLILGLHGALRSSASQPSPWPNKEPFQKKLKEILDAPEAAQSGSSGSARAIVAPPIYGSWHAAKRTVPINRPYWLRELNLDPRHRAVAGFGTMIVQDQQEQLMASAWKQVGKIEKLNQALRHAQLARSVGSIIHERHLGQMDVDAFLQVTEKTHRRVLMSPHTLNYQIRQSVLPEAALSAPFRRISRPRGPLAKRLLPEGERTIRPIIQKLNSGEIAAAPPRKAPTGTVSMDDVSNELYPSYVPSWLRPLLPYSAWILTAIALVCLVIAVALRGSVIASLLIAVSALLLSAAAWARKYTTKWQVAAEVRFENAAPDEINAAPGRPDFRIIPEGGSIPPQPGAIGGTDSPEASRFRAAATAHQAHLIKTSAISEPDPKPSLMLDEVQEKLYARLDPYETVPARVLGRLKIPAEFMEPEDQIAEVMAAPEFETPMYKSLSQDLLMPGIEHIPSNTITLLETNPKFIEAFAVGANHAMGEELLWRGFPTDRRGTYFRQFWDISGHVPPPVTEEDREKLKDIKPIHTWPSSNELGDSITSGSADGRLVLLIRGELLRRYPNAMIYAVKGKWVQEEGKWKRKPSTDKQDERYKIFGGTLYPDITFMGFDLAEKEARGSTVPEQNLPGWFFVIQQHATEPRFGLDADTDKNINLPNKWSDLAWRHVRTNSAGYIDVAETHKATVTVNDPTIPVKWDSDSSGVAYITLRRPFRISIHADDMLPQKSS